MATWTENNFSEIGRMWAKAPKTHALGIANGNLFLRQKDSLPLDPKTIEWPPVGCDFFIVDGALSFK
jgi:hypothetical protein